MALEQEKNIPLYSLLLQTYAQPQHFFFFFFHSSGISWASITVYK